MAESSRRSYDKIDDPNAYLDLARQYLRQVKASEEKIETGKSFCKDKEPEAAEKAQARHGSCNGGRMLTGPNFAHQQS